MNKIDLILKRFQSNSNERFIEQLTTKDIAYLTIMGFNVKPARKPYNLNSKYNFYYIWKE